MSGETIAFAAAVTMMLALAVTSLRGRQIAWAQGWKMGAIWIALFALTALVFSWAGM